MPYLVDPVLPPGAWSGHEQPVMSSGRRTLRPWSMDDAPSLVEAYADPDIQQWHARTMSLPEAQEWIRAKAQSWRRESATDWAFDAGLHRIDLRHAVANPASCRVAEACGYRHEGTATSAMLHGDGWHDMHVHGAVRPQRGRPAPAS